LTSTHSTNSVCFRSTKALHEGLDGLSEYIAWHHARVLYGINFDVRPSGARIILKTLTAGRAEIAFINASTLERCLEVLESYLTSDANVGVQWKPDKYFKP